MILAPRRPRRRTARPASAPSVLCLAGACFAPVSFAAEPVTANAGSDKATMEHAAPTTEHGDAAGGATGTDHGETDHDGTDHGAHAGTSADAPATEDGPAALAATSADGLYRVELRNLPEPVPLNRMHEWVVHVEAADGAPVTGASIEMDGGMPIHDHGLPTAPRVTAELGNGDYRLEGVRFQMPGHWVVELAIDAAPGADSVAFDLNL